MAETSKCRSSRRASVGWVISVLTILVIFMYYGGQSNLTATDTHGRRLVSTHRSGISRSNHLEELGTVWDEEDSEFIQKQAEIQRQRHETVEAACRKHNKPVSKTSHITKRHNRFIVDPEHKLIYCSVAKIASTNWRLVFERLAGVVNDTQLDQKKINREFRKQLSFLDDVSTYEGNKLMDESISFVFARHPFSRILSSYRNKLDPDSTFERAYHWQSMLGQKIINLYRHNINEFRRGMGRTRTNGKRERHKVPPGYDLKFSEFVRYLGDEKNQGSETRFIDNIHWVDVNSVCDPCSVQYDVIGKLETIEDDAKYILKLAHVDHLVSFPSPNISSPTYSFRDDVLTRYLKDVPAEYIWDLYKRYSIDFDLFGYDLPPVVLKKLRNIHVQP